MQNGAEKFTKSKPPASQQARSTLKPRNESSSLKEKETRTLKTENTSNSGIKPSKIANSSSHKERHLPKKYEKPNTSQGSKPIQAKNAHNNPWNYKVGSSNVTAEELANISDDEDNILIDIEGQRDSQVLEDLLNVHTKCSALFAQRLISQKLADTLQLLDMDCKSDFIKQILDQVVQFLLMRPDFLLEQENDGYLVFKNLIRSEVFSFLDFLLSKKAKTICQSALYDPKEPKGMMAKLETFKEERETIYEYVQKVVEAILPLNETSALSKVRHK